VSCEKIAQTYLLCCHRRLVWTTG